MAVPSACAARIMSITTCLVASSRLAVGSSSNNSRGRAINARPRLMRCCSPPLNVMGLACHSSGAIPNRCSHSSPMACASPRSICCRYNGSQMVSSAETRGRTRRNCEQKPISCSRRCKITLSSARLRSIRPTCCDSNQIAPDVGRYVR